MSGWHPEGVDGGLMPNPGDPNNPANAFNPTKPPSGTAPLYFGNGCDVRLRPAVINSLISENLSVVDSVGLNYDPHSLINLRTAIEYIEQKSLPEFAVLNPQGSPANYFTGALYPPLIGYNNGMTLCVVPTAPNQGFVRVDLGAGWWVPVLRNDHRELEADDWPAHVPQCIAYMNGSFIMLGLAKSQVPIVLKGSIYFWVRPDGNDAIGDGTANDPSKAFRTIDGAWSAVGSRFAASPSSHIGFLLGVPGDYEGGTVGPYGAAVSVTGDVNNPSGYRLHAKNYGGHTSCLNADGINSFTAQGLTCWMDDARSTPYGNRGLSIGRSNGITNNVDFVLAVNHPFYSMMLVVEFQSNFGEAAGWVGQPSSTMRFLGHGNNVGNVMYFAVGCSMQDHSPDFFTPPLWYFENIRVRDEGIKLGQFCTVSNATRNWVQTGCTGKRHSVTNTSNLILAGRLPPGDQPGTHDALSQVSP